MRAAALEALQLDPTLAEAHVARGWVYAREFEWSEAEGAFREAIRLDPKLIAAYTSLAISTLQPLGRLADAERLLREAGRINPLAHSVPLTLGRVLLYARPAGRSNRSARAARTGAKHRREFSTRGCLPRPRSGAGQPRHRGSALARAATPAARRIPPPRQTPGRRRRASRSVAGSTPRRWPPPTITCRSGAPSSTARWAASIACSTASTRWPSASHSGCRTCCARPSWSAIAGTRASANSSSGSGWTGPMVSVNHRAAACL